LNGDKDKLLWVKELSQDMFEFVKNLSWQTKEESDNLLEN